ncbi:MAG: HEAT repeat domain-containing protein [Nitrospira sp.]
MYKIGALILIFITAPALTASAGSSSTVESKAAALFKAGDYPEVAALYRDLPSDATASTQFLRLSLLSYIHMGRTDEALAIYAKLDQPGQPPDSSLLRPLALGVITSHVRDRKEHVRVAAYSALAELGLPETAAILEDGLLDTSVIVRARAAEAIGKAGLAGKSGALRRALRDEMPTVRIAAMSALGEAKVTDVQARLLGRCPYSRWA